MHNCGPIHLPSSVSESLQRGPFPQIPNPSPEVKCFLSIIQSTALFLQTVQHETLQFHPCGKTKSHLSHVFLSIIPQCMPHLWHLFIDNCHEYRCACVCDWWCWGRSQALHTKGRMTVLTGCLFSFFSLDEYLEWKGCIVSVFS